MKIYWIIKLEQETFASQESKPSNSISSAKLFSTRQLAEEERSSWKDSYPSAMTCQLTFVSSQPKAA